MPRPQLARWPSAQVSRPFSVFQLAALPHVGDATALNHNHCVVDWGRRGRGVNRTLTSASSLPLALACRTVSRKLNHMKAAAKARDSTG